jgi:hypothetical protein
MKYTAAIGRALGTGSGALSKPISGVKGELFGKDAFGNPRAGTKFLGKRFGTIMGGLTGGTFDNENNRYGIGVGKFRIPHPLGGIVPGTNKREKNIVGRKSKAAKTYEAEEERRREAERAATPQQEPSLGTSASDTEDNPPGAETAGGPSGEEAQNPEDTGSGPGTTSNA